MEYVLGCKWQIFVSFRVFGTKFQYMFPYTGLLRPQVENYGNKQENLNFDVSV